MGRLGGASRLEGYGGLGGGVVPGAGDTAVFPSSASVVNPILDGNASVAGITIDDSQAAYSISDGGTYTLTVGSGGISVTNNGTAAATTAVSVNLSLLAAESLTTTDNTGDHAFAFRAVAAGNVVTIAGNGGCRYQRGRQRQRRPDDGGQRHADRQRREQLQRRHDDRRGHAGGRRGPAQRHGPGHQQRAPHSPSTPIAR